MPMIFLACRIIDLACCTNSAIQPTALTGKPRPESKHLTPNESALAAHDLPHLNYFIQITYSSSPSKAGHKAPWSSKRTENTESDLKAHWLSLNTLTQVFP